MTSFLHLNVFKLGIFHLEKTKKSSGKRELGKGQQFGQTENMYTKIDQFMICQ